MRSSFEHLPDVQRHDLERVLEILFRGFGEVIRRRSARHCGQILKVIQYGHSHPAETRSAEQQPQRDYNLLVVVSSDEHANVADYWTQAFGELDRAYEISHELSARTHIVVHSLAELNRELGRGRPYFVDIVREGVALFESSDEPLASPSKMSPERAYSEAEENFDECSANAAGFMRTASHAIADGDNKVAAFLLNQAAEQLYHCVLLTETLHTTRSHNLNFLRSQAERVAPEVIPVWPRHSRFEERTWELLRRAYTEARFSKHFRITAEQLAWLAERLADLQRRVENSCQEYLATVAPAQQDETTDPRRAVLQS